MTSAAASNAIPRSFFVPARVDPSRPPQLAVVVDTEEEFDWDKPFSRQSVGVSAIQEVSRLQTLARQYGFKPTYVIDYPVATTRSSAECLSAFAHRNECHIGAHLHPWVSPPFTETVNTYNSYACNLEPELERQKIALLQAAIAEHLDVPARSYKAGRYGFGRSTADTLEALGFDVDLSVNPHMDFTGDGGPSFEGFGAEPAHFGSRRHMLELPCTTGFVGFIRRAGPGIHRAASTSWLAPFRAVGVLARSGALNKVMLSPEGNTYEEMRALTETLHHDGVRTFALTFHSPSLKPGCTRYARTVEERDAFLDTINQYCDYFFGKLGGVPTTPLDLFDQLRSA